jgi:hypothetical protein
MCNYNFARIHLDLDDDEIQRKMREALRTMHMNHRALKERLETVAVVRVDPKDGEFYLQLSDNDIYNMDDDVYCEFKEFVNEWLSPE